MENWTNSELQDDDITQDYLQAVQWELEPAHDGAISTACANPNLNISIRYILNISMR